MTHPIIPPSYLNHKLDKYYLRDFDAAKQFYSLFYSLYKRLENKTADVK